MEVLLIEKETFDTIMNEHEMLCEMVNTLAIHIRRKSPNEMMSVSEVCEFLNISPNTLQNLRMNGKIGFMREEGNAVSYPRIEVLRYLERCGVPSILINNGR